MSAQLPWAKARGTRTAPDVLARLDGLEKSVVDLGTSLAERDLRISEIARLLSEQEGRLSRLTAPVDRTHWLPRLLSRPYRVVRKRLKASGLWPQGPRGSDNLNASSDPLGICRLTGPLELRPFFHRLTRYEAWQQVNAVTQAAQDEIDRMEPLHQSPLLISIVTPVYNTPVHLLAAAIASVRDQLYDEWELCIADDASDSPATRAYLDRLVDLDPRIKVVRAEKNSGISAATNLAASIASGEIIAFLDHDDLITPDCLAEIAAYYVASPLADMVYSDDDKIDDDGRRYAPQFKPDWAPTLLLSYMYMSHVLTVRRELFLRLGGFREAFDGAQDYDFALRASEVARHVGHIPRILYHWRATEGSTATSGDAKPHSFKAGQIAVQEALDRRSIKAEAFHPDWAMQTKVGMFSIRFPDEGPRVTIIVPTYNQLALLRRCIETLSVTTYRNYEILLIDNGSTDPAAIAYLQMLSKRLDHRVVTIPQRSTGFSFAALMNEAVTHVSSPFVLFLNNDTEVIEPSWLSQMMGHGQMDGVGAVGARLYFGDRTLQHGGIVHGYHEGLVGHAFRNAAPHDWGYMGFIRTSREYSAVTAACMLTPRATFEAIGGFDEVNFAVAYNDVDYCYRLVLQGLNCVYCANAELFHFEGKSRGYSDSLDEVIAFRQLYGGWTDRWYNPNLSLENEQFEVQSRRLPARTSEPVRVVAITHNLRPEGAPNTLLDLLIGLKRQGLIEPVVLSPGEGPLRRDYEAAGIEVRLFDQPIVGANLVDYQKATDVLAQTLASLGPEVVVANTLTTFYAIDAAGQSGIASIWCQHESEPWETYFDGLNNDVRCRAYAAFAQAYRVTYVAEATRQTWAPVQTRFNAQTIRHGVPPERLEKEVARWSRRRARRRLGVGKDDLVIIVLGTVCRRKGQIDIIDAFAKMTIDQASQFRVFIAGALAEPDYIDEIVAALRRLSPVTAPRIEVVGPVPDMMLYYAGADLFVCTSRIESAPRVIVEAMAFGLPIITTPVFGIPEIVRRDVNALFYEPTDAAGLAEQILRLAVEPTARARLASNSGKVLASQAGYAEMLSAYASLFREAALLRSTPTIAEPAQ